jgi:phosphohistidine phosphatase SixA
MRRLPVPMLPTALVLSVLMLPRPDLPAQEPVVVTTVFLVRHAEKEQDGSRDPALTPAGRERATALADLLEEAGLTAIYATDFRRTRDTAAPLAERLGLPVTLYGARELVGLAAGLKRTPGRYLVSGHSDTTPNLVVLLGGEPGPPFVEEGGNDRLYILTLQPDGRAETVVLRYGKRFRPPGR